MATTIFEFSVLIACVLLKVYLTLQKLRTPFTICEVNICFVLYKLHEQFSHVAVFTVHLNLRIKTADWLLVAQHTISWLDRWAIPGTMHSVTNCQYRTKFFICYLNDNICTPVCRFSSVIMYSCHWDSRFNLGMQGHWIINFWLRFPYARICYKRKVRTLKYGGRTWSKYKGRYRFKSSITFLSSSKLFLNRYLDGKNYFAV